MTVQPDKTKFSFYVVGKKIQLGIIRARSKRRFTPGKYVYQ